MGRKKDFKDDLEEDEELDLDEMAFGESRERRKASRNDPRSVPRK
ncbi:hypothetical protein GCM10007108_09920 [Thermogymnomonas acidicola]|uniref:Uncharacterized protein n=1 Tax=Thermogymnomonas acidicola TaxID=399579 RepID=A0AA37BRD7_9ARCH|nr:hypothetical protein GCM10007108_09920 [Thermogymnomonas acidicola]